MAIATVDSRVQKFKNLYADSMNKDLATLNQTAEAQKKVINDTYGKEIEDTKQNYAEQQQLNEIQKYVNERAIAENMANGGLQNSGLNDTQRAAVQLSYANNKSKIGRALDSAVENFRIQMNAKLTDIENNRISGESSIRQSYDNAALKAAQDEYDTEYKNETERYNQAIKSQESITKELIKQANKKSTTKLDSAVSSYKLASNGNVVYTDKNGNTITVAQYHNPYNNKYNEDAVHGTFTNGYQPNNVGGNRLSETGIRLPVTNVLGNTALQYIYKYKNGDKTYYAIWDGNSNKYYTYTKKELKTNFGIEV